MGSLKADPWASEKVGMSVAYSVAQWAVVKGASWAEMWAAPWAAE